MLLRLASAVRPVRALTTKSHLLLPTLPRLPSPSTPSLFTPLRFFSSSSSSVAGRNPTAGGSTTITFEEAVNSQKLVLKTLQSDIMKQQFMGIKHSDADLVTKWQTMLGLILPLQVQAIISIGYEGNQSGLQEFQQDLQSLLSTGDGHELRELNDEKWAYLLEVVFDTSPGKKLSLQEARAIASDLSSAMQSEEFLREVDALMGKMPEGTPAGHKRQALLTILIPLHISVLSRHGFPGDSGYIQAQLALMEHMADQVVSTSVLAGTMAMFSRAGFN